MEAYIHNGTQIDVPVKKKFHEDVEGGVKLHRDDFELNPAVIEYFLDRFGKPGSTLLHIRAGSGSGAVAAAFRGMHSINLDVEKDAVLSL